MLIRGIRRFVLNDIEYQKVAVVCGGTSTEREVSKKSGAAVYNALCTYGYKDVTLFDLKADNFGKLLELKPDIAFIALHGLHGEDGCIQGALELAGIRYTGSGVYSSALCMDKIRTKELLTIHGIPTPDYVCFSLTQADYGRIAEEIGERIGFPAVIKSPSQGSSIGVYIVNDSGSAERAVSDLRLNTEAGF